MENEIRRLVRDGATRARAAAFDNIVVTVSTARSAVPGTFGQAAAALALLQKHLEESGSDKSLLLGVLVFLCDIRQKPEFNRAWDAWVDRRNPPVRACVESGLENGDLVELVAIAAAGTVSSEEKR